MTPDSLVILKAETVHGQQLPNNFLRRSSSESVLDLAFQQLISKIFRQLALSQISLHKIITITNPTSYSFIVYYWGRGGVMGVGFLGESKMLYTIIDSKRTMKNSIKKDNKAGKKPELVSKKPPPLEFTQPIHTQQLRESALLKTLLPSATSKLMQGFSTSQKQIITQEFGKMIKTLKKKLTSPDKIQNTQRSKLETKTQRFNYNESTNPTNTIKKTISSTQRKYPQPKPSKPQAKPSTRQPVITSPKKSTRNYSSQLEDVDCRSSGIASPAKNKKMGEAKKKGKLMKSKRKKTTVQSDKQDKSGVYMLMGDTFVEIDNGQVEQIHQGIIHHQSKSAQNDPDLQIEQIWQQFFNQKKKLTKTPDPKPTIPQQQPQQKQKKRKYSREQTMQVNVCDEYIKSINQSQCSSIVDRALSNSKGSCQARSKMFYEEFYNGDEERVEDGFSDRLACTPALHSNIANDATKPNTNILNIQQTQSQTSSYQTPQLATPSPQKPPNFPLESLQTAINLQLKTNKQILSRLLQSSKIDKKQYQKYMDIVMENYDKEMTDIQRLRDIIDTNQQKVWEINRRVNEGLRMSERVEDLGVDVLLGNVFSGYDRSKLDNKPVTQENQQNRFLQFNKSHIYQTHITPQSPPTQPQHIPHASLSTKTKIQHRISTQLNILPSIPSTHQKQQINTSIISVYQFIRSFYAFLIKFHLDQFLMYVNMPYGYSVQQRLRYMQGYDDDEDKEPPINQIVYGLEEVIRPALLDLYYKSPIYEIENQKKDVRVIEWQRIHNRVIFDAINQAINRFRPYYAINGCPYQWTTTQKALTYYFIREDCYEQLLEKVQVQVLKWSSSLCGLLIQTPCLPQHSPQPQPSPTSIQQIFQKYTIETPNDLLQHRQQKLISQQKIQTQQSNFEWSFHDEFKTALLYQISSCILEDLANQNALIMLFGCQIGIQEIMDLIGDVGDVGEGRDARE